MRLFALLLALLPIGHSVDGRAIRPVTLGDPAAPHRVLVVGCIHGNEPAGNAIVRRLISTGAPAGTEIVALTSVNPDGCRRGTRQNAHGVDLNRNFPSNWARIGREGSYQYSGPHPLSEPESRYAVALVGRVRPQITIWFHQPQGVVRAWGQSVPTARRFAALAGFPYRSIEWPFGTAANWQNHRFPGTASFVVELPPGPVPPNRVSRWANAIRRLAVEGYRR
ncbi:MAG: murein peptide amidase [Actinomycetia bacterium]|nr:murein peptide amidase [Actinomycetes bacterium]